MSEPATSIPVFSPFTGADTIKAVVDALADGWLGMGRLTQEFETAIGNFLGLKERRVVAVNTGTYAPHCFAVGGSRPGRRGDHDLVQLRR